MSEIMRPIPFPDLIRWAQAEFKNQGSCFGIRKEKFYRYAVEGGGLPPRVHFVAPFPPLRGAAPPATPPLIGPAAGPHTQLAQNILAAYLSGARFMELKTVQALDGAELRKCIARPCINAADEGYNVEWSSELTLAQAREEYVKAWFLCHVFAKEFCIADSCDFIFNMSVGYDLDGIRSAKIDSYIEGMKNASETEIWKRCYDYIAANITSFDHFTKNDLDAVSPHISNSITLSTLHGCPREEIEKIAAYLLSEKKLHTYIKCNPTLLGYESARRLLDEMGYAYISFDDHHFKNDLQFDDAVEMLGRLKVFAGEHGLDFGVKLTNTFPVQVKRKELPGNEMYLSGRALFPLSLNVAQKLSQAFKGKLPISYSGGADYFNLKAILKTGIGPVTVATTILKPGAYERFYQLAGLAQQAFSENHAPDTIDASTVIDTNNLKALVEQLPGLERYRKVGSREWGVGSRDRNSDNNSASELCPGISNNTSHSPLPTPHSPLPLFNCFQAPCKDIGCPIHQRIPDYLAAVAAENYLDAFAIIASDNTAPSITGAICDHQCQRNCTRLDYEDPLEIRQAKLIAANNAQEAYTDSMHISEIKTEKSVAIIGAGPAGIAAAVFLRRNGVPVTVYEKREKPFGMVQYLIPSFRIPDEAILRDFKMAEKIGVEFRFKVPEHYSLADLRKAHEFVVIATGAWEESAPPFPTPHSPHPTPHYIDALRFLEDSKKSNCGLELGKRVAVIGGGDVAMDCAKAAKRNKGVEYVALVYRRTREFMPSQYEEQELALAEGVEFLELLAPEAFTDGVLRCELMRLGAYDGSGRRGIEGTGEKRELFFDTVIGATGAGVDTAAFARNGISLNAKGLPQVNAACESSVPGVYIAGDCRAGAATVVKAIADGKTLALDILGKLGLEADFAAGLNSACERAKIPPDFSGLYLKKGIIAEARPGNADAYRCLSCNVLCEICADVCPNRANVMVEIAAGKCGLAPNSHQLVHIDRMCNECGNCAVFCPYIGKPYKDKFTIFSCEEDFADSGNPGLLKTGIGTYKLRLEDKSTVTYRGGETNIPDAWVAMIDTIEGKYGYLLVL